MSFVYGILAALLEKFLAWIFGFAQRMWQAYLDKVRIFKKNAEIKKQMDEAKNEQERKDALRRAAEHLGNPNP